MPYPFSFTIDSLQVDYDTVEAIPVVSTVSTEDRYHYGYNGKYKDNEFAGIGNHLDYGGRLYDPRIGRWTAKDPLYVKYPFASPYSFALNTPIQANDPDGRVVIFINGQKFGFGDNDQDYWKVFAKKVMSQIGDPKSLYYDGSLGGWANTLNEFNSQSNMDAKTRYEAGYKQAMAVAKDIINNLNRDKDGKIIESVKIVAHSFGGAYAKGFVAALNHYANDAANNEALGYNNPMSNDGKQYYPSKTMIGFKIDYEVDFASFQPNSDYNSAVPGIRTIQVSHSSDWVVNNDLKLGGSYEAKEKGVKNGDYHLNLDHSKGHPIQSFNGEIKFIPTSGNSKDQSGGNDKGNNNGGDCINCYTDPVGGQRGG